MLKPIPLIKYKKFLKSISCIYIRTKGSHEIWNKEDDSLIRPIIFRTNKKEVPIIHIHTNLKTLGMSIKEFNEIISKV